ncbi:MAG: Flp pilus assembly protein CpaB, partial [Rhodospirillaceae bacterium]|nr:Flp pilus assembly protein CpaB [Rhodospirillaceae bacterium]
FCLIFVPFGHYDELKILSYAIPLICSIGADVRQPILAEKLFKRKGAGFMAGALQEGMRAVSIKVTAATATSGFIFPGDYVDVVLTHNKGAEAVKKQKAQGQKDEEREQGTILIVLSHLSETIVRNVRIIAIGNKVDQFKKKGQAMVVKTVTLEVTPRQAEVLATGNAMGKMSLALRSMAGKSDLGSPRTYTTDIEVSPFMDKLVKSNKALKAKKEQEAETARLKLEQEVKDRADKARVERERRNKERAEQTKAAREARAKEREARAKERVALSKSKDRSEIRRLQEELAKRDNRVLPPVEEPKIEVKEVKKESPPKPRTVKIYRGGSASTEEVKIK